MQAGYAQDVITPTLDRPVFLAGFGQDRRAETVHDDLYVRALALEGRDVRLVVAALDLIGLPRPHCQEIEARVAEQAPGTRLWVACTHTHHGPDTIGFWGPDMATSGVDPEHLAGLKDRVVAAALAALDRLQPAHLRCTSLPVTGLAKNARDPEILDEELTCLQFCEPDTGAPLATWLIYPCHPEVLWDDNPHITSDYPHPLREAVEAATGAPCLFLSGAIGGMMTPDVVEHSFEEADRIGQALARAALKALQAAAPEPVADIAYARHEYTVHMTNPLFQMASDAGLLPNLVDDTGAITTEANLLKLGPDWLFGVPGELLPRLGLAFKEKMRRAHPSIPGTDPSIPGADPSIPGTGARFAAVIGLTNDELGYILPREDFVYPDNPFEPGDHYEETMSIGPEAGPRLAEALQALLSRQE